MVIGNENLTKIVDEVDKARGDVLYPARFSEKQVPTNWHNG
ncbi:MAG: hypothetical protein DHS20C10_04600 [marine bacterium B5-7]|nr:MAG: hypothetical protein DHS20C10_04600 [marine bacterium B5-7]